MADQRKIRVLYDEQIFLLQQHGGISRYFIELIRQFKSHPELGVIPQFAGSRFRNAEIGLESGTVGAKELSESESLMELLRALGRNRCPETSADVVHHTFYLPGYLSRFPSRPKVTTLFDMIPEYVDRGIRPWSPHFRKRAYFKHSAAVVSISDTSTADMRRRYGFTFPVETTYLGVSPDFTPDLPAIPGLPAKYFLFVGNRGGYKNSHVAFEAFSQVAGGRADVYLVLSGGGPLTRIEKRKLKELGISNQVVQKSFLSNELNRVYANSEALVYPTKYEGFGLPLVEAMASGLPILASSTPINREIAGSTATYFDPESSAELAKLLTGVLDDSTNLKAKIMEGLTKAESFNWYRCAELTAEVYREVLSRESRTR